MQNGSGDNQVSRRSVRTGISHIVYSKPRALPNHEPRWGLLFCNTSACVLVYVCKNNTLWEQLTDSFVTGLEQLA